MRARFALGFALSQALALLPSCHSGEVAVPSLTFHDPRGLMDVIGDLRLVVFDAEGRSCTADGTVLPELSDAPDAVFPDAVVDITFPTDAATQVNLFAGSYLVHVRGRGTDPVTGRTNQIVATGCVDDVLIEEGQTREITVELKDVVGMGECGDGILSPDEQCEAATGPLPCDACRTQPFAATSTTTNLQDKPSAGWAAGQRLVVSFDSESTSPRGVMTMFRSDRGEVVTSPAALAIDVDVDVGMTIPGVQTTTATAVSPARVAIAFGDFRSAMTEGGDVQVRFFDLDRAPLANATQAVPSPGAQTNPKIAMMPDGNTLVVFDDGVSTSGASAVHFAAGSTSPGAAVAIGTSGASAPAVAAHAGGFVVAYVQGGQVLAARYDAEGASVGEPVTVGAGAQPTVAALADGRFYVAFDDGGSVRGRAYTAEGAPASDALLLGPGVRPAAGAGAERFFVAWESSGQVRARVVDGAGAPARNRENPPTPDAFTVSAGAEPTVAVGGPTGQTWAFVGFTAGGDVQGRLYPLP
ncbi:MAG: hypothetical protein KF901_02005 [Myxococcales bacterium]|nr:hypothetical protein [Myxococcales bacterium]